MATATAQPATKPATRITDPLQRSVLAVLAFFDVLDHPLTLAELERSRFSAPARASFTELLAATQHPAIACTDGHYHLAGREATVARRQRGERLAEPKFRKALRAARWMRWLPSVRMVAVCNSLAMTAPDAGSDIDLFVVVRPGTAWVTRLLTVGVLALTGQRPHGADHADKVCLSFFVSDRALNVEALALPGGDPYLAQWVASLLPIYDPEHTLAEVMAQNAWVRRMVPGAYTTQPIAARRVAAPAVQLRWLLPAMCSLNAAARGVQERRFPPRILALMNRDTRVVVNDDVLKFHVDDRRAEIAAAYRERCAALGL